MIKAVTLQVILCLITGLLGQGYVIQADKLMTSG